ncbi:MAG: NERD domain-containing protein [Legionellales bacterium]|nr:NERD domain-containing protein [Legionellales bacterium]
MSELENLFQELEELCSSDGYIHIIAFLWYRDIITPMSVRQQYFSNHERLIRKEISILTGLLIKANHIDDYPGDEEFVRLTAKTEKLIKMLHQSLVSAFCDNHSDNHDESTMGAFFREAILYEGEGPYYFQYLDLAKVKYQFDNDWLVKNKGFSIHDACAVVQALFMLMENKLRDALDSFDISSARKLPILDTMIFTAEELKEQVNCEPSVIEAFLAVFSTVGRNENAGFKSFFDYNLAERCPIIKIDNKYVMFQPNSLAESIYESPFYWMNQDNEYISVMSNNRGNFTENFAFKKLETIFGKENVYQNVVIKENNKIIGEIDVLVVYTNIAIIVQAKSKKLTLRSKGGDIKTLENDFKKAVEDSYEQGVRCAEFLSNKKYLFVCGNKKIAMNNKNYQIFIMCLLSDNYPSLAAKTRNLLFNKLNIHYNPYVIDVFILDILCELLSSPLYFLYYLKIRCEYFCKIINVKEYNVLSFYLSNNLHISDDVDIFVINDEETAELDRVMFSRRVDSKTMEMPQGILTVYADTSINELIKKVKCPKTVEQMEFGFYLLSLNPNSALEINALISQIANEIRQGKTWKVASFGNSEGGALLTIICDKLGVKKSQNQLKKSVKKNNGLTGFNIWYGIGIKRDANLSAKYILASKQPFKKVGKII